MKLALGTAQFGLDYGVVNSAGQLTQEQANDVIGLARSNGINVLDTAVAYGSSEKALGMLGVGDFHVITKLPPIAPDAQDLEDWVTDQMTRSLERLQIDSVYALLLHSPDDLLGSHGKALLNALAALKKKGLCKKVGVSIYRPGQLDEIWPHFRPDIVQCPYSVLDRRLETSGWADRLKADNVELHIRSIFLQGLLLMAPDELPAKFLKWKPEFEAIAAWAMRNGVSQAEAAIGCALALPSAEQIVVGVDGVAQLEEIIKAGEKGGIAIPMQLACDDEKLVDPTQW